MHSWLIVRSVGMPPSQADFLLLIWTTPLIVEVATWKYASTKSTAILLKSRINSKTNLIMIELAHDGFFFPIVDICAFIATYVRFTTNESKSSLS